MNARAGQPANPMPWARVGIGALLLAIGVLAWRWVAAPELYVLWAALLVALWLLSKSSASPGHQHRPLQAAAAAAPADPADVPLQARLASMQSELTSLRGVQRELIAAKQAAESAMLAKSEFLASMSHEIRTPLNGILPLLDIVLGTELSPVQREYLVTANASAQELLRIVDDILDYSKAEAGKLDLECVAINVRELVESVRRLLLKPAEAKCLTVRAVVDADVRAQVRGDPMRLRQILTNLMGNAIKFTQRGGVSVRVSRRGETATHHELLFAVRDTGIGLAPEVAARLFQPFTQADASVTRRYGGTGLGLTICKKLVDLMGGRIGVRSEPDRGSVFWFSVPFEKMPGEISGARKDLAGLRTLVACSQGQAQRLLPLLAGIGLDATHVTDGTSTLMRLRQAAPLGRSFNFELLVLDAGSIGGDVTKLLQMIVNDQRLASLQILALDLQASPSRRLAMVGAQPDEATLRRAIRELFGLAADGRPQPLLDAGTATPQIRDAGVEPKLTGHVLLVEDHPVNQKVAQKLLARLGLTVDLAENGEAALERIRDHRFDLVLMDCQMPVLDGYSATRRLREMEREQLKPRLPVVAMTAHAMAGDRERCLQAGMDDYLSKPLDRGQLAQTVAHWLNMSGSPPAPQEPRQPADGGETAAAPAAGPAPPADTLDVAALRDLEEIMGDEVLTLVDAYLRDGDTRLRDMRAAADRGDSAEVGRLAHSLKSSSANLGATPLAQRARSVEEAARRGTLADPAASVAVLEKLYADTALALKRRFKRPA
jgi:signal transduction histidine kinase/CheY-like chemotaxis protein/HPt (histidine-containing phosphotransfer) domain-containing protein